MSNRSPLPARETARMALERGYSPVLVKKGQKRPVHRDWQTLEYTLTEIDQQFQDDCNVGLRWGTSADGQRVLIDCDFETPEAVRAAKYLLPRTDFRWGREGHPDSHWVYQLSESMRTRKFYDLERNLICELRGEKSQSVIPDSISPKGGQYIWSDEAFGTPTELEIEPFLMLMKAVALSVVLADLWEGCGARHDAALALSGFLLKVGYEVDDTVAIIQAITHLAGDEEERDRINAARSTYQTFENGGEIAGSSALETIFGSDFLKWILALYKVRITADMQGAADDRLFNDLGNARYLLEFEGEDMAYISDWKRWAVWTGTHWDAADGSLEYRRRIYNTFIRMREVARALPRSRMEMMMQHILNSENSRNIEGMAVEARALFEHRSEEFDQDLWVFNCRNGSIDLRTGRFSEHRREDYITKMAPVIHDPEAECPRWLQFLDRIFEGDQHTISYVQRLVGYCLTGSITEQCLFFLHGTGKNGKSTFVETIAALMGPYSMKLPVETLMAKKGDNTGIPNDLARLPGSRLVTTREMEANKWLAEGIVKDLTGGDQITARFLRAEFFDFTPTHKIVMYGNHKPLIKGADEGIWRRIRLVPFTVTIPEGERDRQLGDRLRREELSGIFNWVLEGCQEWLRLGLQESPAVQAATEEYRAEMDVMGEFLNEHYVEDPNGKVSIQDIFTNYIAWCTETGEHPVSQRVLSNKLVERGLEKKRVMGGKWVWKGLRPI